MPWSDAKLSRLVMGSEPAPPKVQGGPSGGLKHDTPQRHMCGRKRSRTSFYPHSPGVRQDDQAVHETTGSGQYLSTTYKSRRCGALGAAERICIAGDPQIIPPRYIVWAAMADRLQ